MSSLTYRSTIIRNANRCRPIGDTEGMSRLTAKGANIEAQIPLGRQGKRGKSFVIMRSCLR